MISGSPEELHTPSADDLIADFNRAYAELTAPGAPFAWTVREVRGAPTRIFDRAPPNMRVIWELTAAKGDAEYLVYGTERYSYSDAAARVRSLAHHLRNEHGVGRGDRVAIAMRNYPEWVLSYWAITSLGAAAVAVNSWWTGPELEFALDDSSPVVAILDGERLERLSSSTGTPALIVTRHDGDLPVGAARWDDVVDADGAPARLPAAEIEPDDDIGIFYTSGTTGPPKGAQTTHRGSIHNLLNLAFIRYCGDAARARRRAEQGLPPPGEDPGPPVALLPVPLFHVTGCTCVLHPVTATGGRLVLMHHWDPAEALRIIERERVTTFTGVPTMSRELLRHPDWGGTDTSSMRSMGGGGAALQPDLVSRIDNSLRRGEPITGYGLTETTGIASAIGSEFYVAKPASVGPVVPCMEAKVVDASGNELATGRQGELLLRGPNVIKGYLDKPEATAQAIVDGWFRTGDIAEIDADGWIHIKDRAKDVVIRGGENVHCAEVEAALHELDEIAEVAVFGVPDDRLGEEVAAAVVLGPGTALTPDDLTTHLTDRLARFKHPRHVWFLDEPLPRNANGKFLKRELRARLAPPG
ncbi:MAG: class I adenylate-forming enzyme family protein [bacterium]|nr:class I adenylate-forming enzyme family protein [bacterium]